MIQKEKKKKTSTSLRPTYGSVNYIARDCCTKGNEMSIAGKRFEDNYIRFLISHDFNTISKYRFSQWEIE